MWWFDFLVAEIGPATVQKASDLAGCLQGRWREILAVLVGALVVGLVMAGVRWAVRVAVEPRLKRVSFGGLWISGVLVLFLVYGLVVLVLALTGGGSFERFLFETLHLGRVLPTVATCLPSKADELYNLATPFYFPVVYALWHLVFLILVFLLFWGMVGSKVAFAPASKKDEKGESREERKDDTKGSEGAGQEPEGAGQAAAEQEAVSGERAGRQGKTGDPAAGSDRAQEEGAGGPELLPEGVLAPVFGPVFQAVGYWMDLKHVEERYRAYAGGVVFALRIARWLALPAAFLGTLPPSLWILASLAVTALKDNLNAPSLLERRRRRKAEAPAGEEKPKQRTVSVPAVIQNLAQADEIVDLESMGGRQAVPARLVDSELLGGSPAMALVSDKLGLDRRLYAHQEACYTHLEAGENVLLATAPLSGRTTVGDLLALHQVLVGGSTVLYVCPDPKAARDRRLALSAVISKADWDWNVYVHDLCNDPAEGLDLQMRQPNILFVDTELLHRLVLPNHKDWEFFLRSLGLVVVLNLEAYTGALGANVYWLFRRFQKVCEVYDTQPRYFATAVPYNKEIRTYAEALLGVPFVYIGPGMDTAPEPAREILSMRAKAEAAGDMPLPVLVAGIVAGLGHRAELFGFESTLTLQEEERIQEVLLAMGKADLTVRRDGPTSGAGVQAPGRLAEIVIAQVDASAVRLGPELTRHFGADLVDVSQKLERVSTEPERAEAEEKGFAVEGGFDLGEAAFGAGPGEGGQQAAPRGQEAAEEGGEGRGDGGTQEAGDRGADEETVGGNGSRDESQVQTRGPGSGKQPYWQQTTAATLLLPTSQPFVELLVSMGLLGAGKGHPDLELGCALVTNPDNELARAKHLRCAMAEAGWIRRELEAAFGRALVERVWSDLAEEGLVTTETVSRPDPATGVVRRFEVCRYVGHPLPHASAAMETVTNEHVSVVDRRTRVELLRLDRVRALTDAYPGLVFLANRRRYRVCQPEDQTGFADGRILADPYERPVITSKVRIATFELAHPERRRGERRRRSAPAASEAERRSGRDRRAAMSHSIGGSAFFLWYPWVYFHEQVIGVKTYDRTGRLLDVTYFRHPIATRYKTRAAIVAFPNQKAPAPVLHSLVHLFSHVLPAFVRHGPFDVDIAYMEEFGEEKLPAIAILDRHPGDAGFATSVTTEVFRHLCLWSHRLVVNCPAHCASPHGCLSCMRSLQCHAPHGGPETDLDREGTLSLIEDLLGGFVH